MAIGCPCSHEETLFSTPADTEALMVLFKKYPYPQHKCFVRKGHGFFILSQSVEEAMHIFNHQVKPHIILD
jgi:hypothetical protein